MKTTILTLGLIAGATASLLAAPVRVHAEASDGGALVREILPAVATLPAAKAPGSTPQNTGVKLRDVKIRDVKIRDATSSSGITASVSPDQTAPSRGGARALGAPAESRGRYRDLIARHAQANGIPFELADAVVRIESRYNPNAHNGGAVGLMQIKPQTARGLGYSGGAGGLTNPDTNLRYGMLYLAQAFRMSGGNTCATVMRYQSGHYATRMSGANRSYCSKARTIMASN